MSEDLVDALRRELAAVQERSLAAERAAAGREHAAAERERAAAERERAAAERERVLRARLERATAAGAAGAADDARPGEVPRGPRLRLLVPPKYSKGSASGFALADAGLDEPVGWLLAAAAFLPEGRIADEVAGAAAEAAEATRADFLSFRAALDLDGGVPLSRSLTRVAEVFVQNAWDEDVLRWWPSVVRTGLSSSGVRPDEFPLPLVLGKSCKVDFLRKVVLGGDGARRVAVVAVAELKNTFYSPLNGVPQALVAAFAAAADLRAQGLPVAQCVVPFLSSTGALEQHGAAYLLEPNLPCAALTTPVLDLTDADGQRRAVAARWAFRRMADRTTDLLVQRLAEAAAPPAAASAPAPALDASRYHVKRPLPFVGRSVEQSVLQQLRVFDRLRTSRAAGVVVLPAAVLMRDPTAATHAAAAAAEAAGAAGAGAEGGAAGAAAEGPRASAWESELAVAFPRLEGHADGVPAPGEPLRAPVLAALRDALRRVHRAGVVHLDLFPGNVLWAARGEGGGGAGGVSLRLVDFDAALLVGQRVPASARDIVERNGHRGSYHPALFAPGARAQAAFDWWHFCLLADDACPFARDAAALPGWLRGAGVQEALLARVDAEVAAEEAAEAVDAGA